MYVFASVTAGTVCPAAIYHVRTIYNPTNNDVPIQYLYQKNHIQIFYMPISSPIICISRRIVAGRHCVSSRPFLCT